MLETVCPFKNSLFDFDQFILVGADAELYSVLDGAVPAPVRSVRLPPSVSCDHRHGSDAVPGEA